MLLYFSAKFSLATVPLALIFSKINIKYAGMDFIPAEKCPQFTQFVRYFRNLSRFFFTIHKRENVNILALKSPTFSYSYFQYSSTNVKMSTFLAPIPVWNNGNYSTFAIHIILNCV
jgi:hypothetical protein